MARLAALWLIPMGCTAQPCLHPHATEFELAVVLISDIGVRANIHLGGQTKFCPNGEHKLFVTRPRQADTNNTELLQCQFFDDRRVVPDERIICYPILNVSQVDGYLFRSVTQLVKQMCCLLPE